MTVVESRNLQPAAQTFSLFQTDWWLDAVAPGRWQAVTVERGGAIVARWPYVWRNRFGLRVITQPPLTQTLGPWVLRQPGKYESTLSAEHKLLDAVIEALPACDLVVQNVDPALTNVLPFHWRGFTVTPRYTYRLDPCDDADALWAGFSDRCRNAIRKAERQLVVREDLGLDVLLELCAKTWANQGLAAPFDAALLQRIDATCVARGWRQLLVAEGADGNRHAAVYVVWDARTAYYLIGASDPVFRSSGANSLLLWRTIQATCGTSRRFDFEGSMNPGIESFFRSFGSRQVPFFSVRASARRMRALTALRDLSVACTGHPRRWFF
jgi:hypothetical protein